jgi:hypothetical protein
MASVADVSGTALVSLDNVWAYQYLDDASVGVEDAWRQPDFDDSSWLLGLGGFSASAPSIYDMTQLGGGAEPWVTVCFRTRFEVEQPEAFSWLVLRADYDDGLVAFLNGAEVARRALPTAGAITRSTVALTSGLKAGEAILLEVPPEILVSGTNVLVVEVHKFSADDASCAFKAELLADFQRGPTIQNLSSNRATITWQTPVPTDAWVKYGEGDNPTSRVSRTDLRTHHVINLANLEPATVYHYQVGSQVEDQRATSPQYSFRTLQVEGPIRFLVVGDSGTGGRYQRRVRDVLQTQPGDFILHTGDVIYHSFTEAYVDLRHFSIYREDLTRRPFYSVFGNHDLYAGDQPYLDAFELPTNTVSGTEHYYSFDHGDVHFTALFLTQRAQAASWPLFSMEEGSPQYQWLTNDLASATKPWKVVFGHVPLASSGGRRLDSYKGLRDQLEYQRILLPVFEQYGVQLYFAGHDHVYERLGPLHGVHNVVSGGGGYTLYGLTERDLASAQFFSRFNVVRVSVDGNRLSAQALADTWEVIDQFSINRAPATEPPAVIWHTPVAPSGTDNGDGNRLGQVFDFPGRGIGAMAGGRANLGELFVAADADALHIGVRDLMLPHSQSLILFLALPDRAGVSSLQGLGDGLADPEAEGVEALDAMESLSFESFRPVIGCVLGDEYGDGSISSFPLEDAGVDAGQGIFWLQPGFPEVTGARVQQFDRSPQVDAVPEESRADFCIVSVPRTLMGPFAPGAVLQLGAVAARAGAPLAGGELVAEIDSGYFGQRLVQSAEDTWILEGLSIPLPEDTDIDEDGLRLSQELKHGTLPDNPDSDGDGLLDGWEVNFQIDPLESSGEDGAEGDPDADQLNNLEEQLAGTDPRDATSTLRIAVRRGSPLGYELVWSGRSGRTYNLELSADILGPYTPYAGDGFPRPGSDREEVLPISLDEAAYYFRLRVQRP